MTREHDILSKLPDDCWTRFTSIQLSKLYKIDFFTVKKWRKDHDKPKAARPPGSGRPRTTDWSKYDPSKSVAENAKLLGVTRQAVYYMIKNTN